MNVLPEVLQPDKLDDIPSEPATVVPLSAKVMVHNELIKYRSTLFPTNNTTSALMVGVEILTGLLDKVVQDIVDNCMQVNTVEVLLNMGVSYDIAPAILKIIKDILP